MNLGSKIREDSVCNLDNKEYKLGRHLFLSQLEKSKTLLDVVQYLRIFIMKNKKFQRWFKP
jgi:hypothetical protein